MGRLGGAMLRLVALILVLSFAPVVSLAQESATQSPASPTKELQRYHERYTALQETFTTTLERNLDSDKNKTETDLLTIVGCGLLRADSELFALEAYLFLAEMITQK